MKKERFTLYPCVYVIVRKQDQLLLLLRQNTGYEDGKYCFIGGHADGNETMRQAAAREALEEGGIEVDPEDLRHVHTMHRVSNRENIDMFFLCDRWKGDVQNREPDKCGELAFYPIGNLPQNILPYIKQVIAMMDKGVYYSEFGWS